MTVAIGLGLWRDPAARHDAVKQLKAETTRVVGHGNRVVKLVSARVI